MMEQDFFAYGQRYKKALLGQDKDDSWYVALSRQGNPLLQPYDIFTAFYAAMGFTSMPWTQAMKTRWT